MNILLIVLVSDWFHVGVAGGLSLVVDYVSSFEALKVAMSSPSLPSHKELMDAMSDVIQSGAVESIQQEFYKEGALALRKIVDNREEGEIPTSLPFHNNTPLYTITYR